MAIEIKNNFNSFKTSFKKDTGLEASDNMSLYIQYYQARVTDELLQHIFHRLGDIEKNTRKPV